MEVVSTSQEITAVHTYLVTALPACVQANAVEEVPGALSELCEQLRELDGELQLGHTLRQSTGLAECIQIDGSSRRVQELDFVVVRYTSC